MEIKELMEVINSEWVGRDVKAKANQLLAGYLDGYLPEEKKEEAIKGCVNSFNHTFDERLPDEFNFYSPGQGKLIISGDASVMVRLVLDEVLSAEEKFPNKGFDIVHWSAVLSEEAGEVTRAALQSQFEGKSVEPVVKELIQTAAMCIRMLKLSKLTDIMRQL